MSKEWDELSEKKRSSTENPWYVRTKKEDWIEASIKFISNYKNQNGMDIFEKTICSNSNFYNTFCLNYASLHHLHSCYFAYIYILQTEIYPKEYTWNS